MSHILRHYRFNDPRDISWTISSSLCLVILIVTLFTSLKTLQHIHCIPKSCTNAGFRYKFESRHFKTYSTLFVILATISAISIFSLFPVCSQWQCSDTLIVYMYTLFLWDSYTLCKIFVYLIFIGRLFTPHYIRIYQYPKYIGYLLLILLIILIINMIAFNITPGLALAAIAYPQCIDILINSVYGTTDCILSISLMILFFRPICTRNAVSISPVYKSIVRKYAVISALQLVVAVSFQIAYLVSHCLYIFGAPIATVRVYADVQNILSMLDCLLLIFCIYSGFARQDTVCIIE